MDRFRPFLVWNRGWHVLLGAAAFTLVPSAAVAEEHATVAVVLNQPWTDSGLYLAQGRSITVTAQGVMNWFTGACNGQCISTPAGIPCPGGGAPPTGFVCLSLIGKIGESGVPFEVGDSVTFTTASSGELYLGVLDGNLRDNTGSWRATIASPNSFNDEARALAPRSSKNGARSAVSKGATPPATAATLPNPPPPPPAVDVSGLWWFRAKEGEQQVPIQMDRIADQVTIKLGSDAIYTGRVTSAQGIDGQSLTPQSSPGGPQWIPEHLTVQDPLHLRHDNAPDDMIWRSSVHGDSTTCDPANPSRSGPGYARLRAQAAFDERKDFAAGECWLQIAANQGDAGALAWLSVFANRGLLGADSASRGFEWAKRAASQSDALGEYLLSLYYRQGYGTPVDEQKAAQWGARVRSHQLGQGASGPSGPNLDESLDAMARQLTASASANFGGTMSLIQLLSGALSGPDEETRDRMAQARRNQVGSRHWLPGPQ
jgi:hypothetical protein